MQEGGFRLEVEGSGFLYKQVRNMVRAPHPLAHTPPVSPLDQFLGAPSRRFLFLTDWGTCFQVGLLLAIGKGSVSADEVTKLLQSCDRSLVARLSTTAPPHGLILDSVSYPEHLLHIGCESETVTSSCGDVDQSLERPQYYEPKVKRVYSVNELGEVVARAVQDVP